MLKKLYLAVLDLIYPPKCPVCKTIINTHGKWCSKCLSKVLYPREINLIMHDLTALTACYTMCEYEAGLKQLLHDMKFRRRQDYAIHLSWVLSKGLKQRQYNFDCDVVIPVPLHRVRLSERGYNQTALLFKRWAQASGYVWCEDALIRAKATEAQWKLKLVERRQNIKGAFLVTRPEIITGKNILLVDDIFTSGTTMEECAKVLKNAGALKVIGLTLASGAQ